MDGKIVITPPVNAGRGINGSVVGQRRDGEGAAAAATPARRVAELGDLGGGRDQQRDAISGTIVVVAASGTCWLADGRCLQSPR
ncbi:hypothetical protein [Streptomyces sp. NPDC002209]|uniref:hypothetical protein n=1 Tax=Streptomyces sp. NPDC002209 TaxID=3364638 RepID=UPI0036AE7907